MQQQETEKWMHNGDNIFTSKRQEVYSSNTSVSDVLDKNKIQNNKDFIAPNLYFNKTRSSKIEYCIGTYAKDTIPDHTELVWSEFCLW